MSKKQAWSVTLDEENHEVAYAFSRAKGRMTVTIDGEAFDMPCGLFGCKAARREPFRLGDYQAILAVEKNGRATLIVDGETVAEKQ